MTHWDRVNILFSNNPSPNILAPRGESSLGPLSQKCTEMFVDGCFLSLFFSLYFIDSLQRQRALPLLFTFFFFFFSITMDSWVFLKMVFLSLSILMLSDSEFDRWKPLWASKGSLAVGPSILSTSLLAGIERCSRLILYLSCLSHGIVKFLFPFGGVWYLEIKIWVLGGSKLLES